jgi:hypothetical protein
VYGLLGHVPFLAFVAVPIAVLILSLAADRGRGPAGPRRLIAELPTVRTVMIMGAALAVGLAGSVVASSASTVVAPERATSLAIYSAEEPGDLIVAVASHEDQATIFGLDVRGPNGRFALMPSFELQPEGQKEFTFSSSEMLRRVGLPAEFLLLVPPSQAPYRVVGFSNGALHVNAPHATAD